MMMSKRDLEAKKKLQQVAEKMSDLRAHDPAVLSQASQDAMAKLDPATRSAIQNARRRLGKDPIPSPK